MSEGLMSVESRDGELNRDGDHDRVDLHRAGQCRVSDLQGHMSRAIILELGATTVFQGCHFSFPRNVPSSSRGMCQLLS
jgi:hypothetical protein